MKITLPERIDHLKTIQSYELEQYKNSNVLTTLTTVLISQLQEIEDAFVDLKLKRFILTAYGTTLDFMGDIVGESRNSRPDDNYRSAILVRAILNNGGGTAEDIISAVGILFDTFKIEYKEGNNASFSLFAWMVENESNAYKLKTLRNLVDSIRPLGVKPFITTATGKKPFKFAESTSQLTDFLVELPIKENFSIVKSDGSFQLLVEADTTTSKVGSFGFGEYNSTTNSTIGGGKLAEVIENA